MDTLTQSPPFPFLRLRRYGWGRKLLLGGVALLGSAAIAAGANFVGRHALWQVVRACALDQATTGRPLPCLEVDVSAGESRGWAVLRPPLGEPDTILTPTRAVVGLEDPSLQAPDAPNYFALAWAARRWLKQPDGAAPADTRVALAVNSRLSRSQDQLHVHIGCLTRDFARQLDAALGPKPGEWRRAADMAPGLEFWTWRSPAKDGLHVDPFRLAAAQFGTPAALARVTLAVAPHRDEFVIVALRSRPNGWYAAAEDVVDARCG